MNSTVRRLMRNYFTRRSPWGPPWWIYGVTFGAANVARQSALLLTSAELPQTIGVAWYAASALAVIVVVNTAAVVLGGRTSTRLTPLWPLRRQQVDAVRPAGDAVARPTRPTVVSRAAQPADERSTGTSRWAPWWVYLVVILGANYLRRAVVPDVGPPAAGVVLAIGLAAVLFVAITAIHRALAPVATESYRPAAAHPRDVCR